jgi:hypothetical protein
MNLKTILLNAALGIVTGTLSLFCLSNQAACCCGIPLVVGVPVFLGAMMATLLTRGPTTAASNALQGLGHGLFAGALATGALMIGLNQFTADERVKKVIGSYREQIEEARQAYREMAEEDPDKISEDDLQQMEKLLEDSVRALEEVENDPASVRGIVTGFFGVFAILGGLILGALGGLAGHLAFGKRRPREGEEQPDDPDHPDRMKMPEQPKQWWED